MMFTNCIFLTVLVHVISTSIPQCHFRPNNRLDCVHYIRYPGDNIRCLPNSVVSLEVTGVTKVIAGDSWINVKDDRYMGNMYIRQKDGECSNNCCDNLLRPGRMFFSFGHNQGGPNQGGPNNFMPPTYYDGACHTNWDCQYGICRFNFQRRVYFCLCQYGYTGLNCEKVITPPTPATSPSTTTRTQSTSSSTTVAQSTIQPKAPTTSITQSTSPLTTIKTQPISTSTSTTILPKAASITTTQSKSYSATTSPSTIATTQSVWSSTTTTHSTSPSTVTTTQSAAPSTATTQSTIRTTIRPTTMTSSQPLSSSPIVLASTPTPPSMSILASTPLPKQQELTTTTSTCVDSVFVNCDNDDSCGSRFSKYCPLSCGLCTPTTTPQSCIDNRLMKCSHPDVCTSTLRFMCPLTCGLCRPIPTTELQHDQTNLTTVEWNVIPDQGTTAWLHIGGK